MDLQGRKVKGRMEILQGIRHAAVSALELLGLWPGDLLGGLAQMRMMALARCDLARTCPAQTSG